MTEIRRLYWGADHRRPAGWTGFGLSEGPGIDISCDLVVDGLPIDPESTDCIACQHALEQLEVYDVCAALREFHRVLKPGGVLRLGLSDLDRALDAYKTNQGDYFWCREWNTLGGNFITQITNYGHVRTLFTYPFAEELLQKAGFQTVRRVAYRQTSSSHPGISDVDSRPEESFYVEAFKQAGPPVTEKSAPGTVSQIHLSWVEDPSTSLTVVWRTPSAENRSSVEYREIGCETWKRATGSARPSPGKGVLHQVTITGLRPATAYEYRVSNDNAVRPAFSETFLTATAPPLGPADFSFAFICDTGLIGRPDQNATGTKQIIDEVLADKPLFVLGGGDYAYANRDGRYEELADAIDAWFVQMEPMIARFPFMAQFGNHEILLGERFRDWAPRFALPEGFDRRKSYSFDVGDVHLTAFFVPGLPPSVDLLAWLDADLGAARARGMRWLIVYQHEPIYSHGHSHPAKPEIRKALAPIFERHRVNLHLSGHDQNYERTYPLIGIPTTPTPTSTSQDRYEAGAGVIYAKVSPSGKMSEVRNDFSRFTTEQQPFTAARDDTAHHYALVTVRATGDLAVDVYSVTGDGRPKTLLDRFRIIANTGSRDAVTPPLA